MIIICEWTFKIDYIAKSVYDDKEIHLMPIEYNLLCLLSKKYWKEY